MILVYIDPKTQKVKTVEAHIEVGSLTIDLQDVLNEKHARAVLFRYPDENLAHKAAEIMYQKVSKAEKSGKRIPYDFGMNYQDHDELFCTEVIYQGYRLASENQIEFPSYTTQFHPGLLDFLNILGIQVDEQSVHQFRTFAPGDIQFDRLFEVVAEYRHPAKLRDSREKDLVLSKMFEWMIEKDYGFTPSLDITLKSEVAYLARRTPLLRRKFEDKFPLNMPKDLLKVFLTLDEIGPILQKRIHHAQSFSAESLVPIEIMKLLDRYREEDLQRMEDQKRYKRELAKLKDQRVLPLDRRVRELEKKIKESEPHFHQWFRPKK